MPVRQINLDKRSQGQIIHVIKIFDLSSSMQWHVEPLIKVADAQITEMATASKASDQETRVTIYTFSSPPYHDNLKAKCLIYEKDVLRVPSIAGMGLRAIGNTALCDAVLTVIDEVRVTPEKYGDHSFLVYLLTDGEENSSQYGAKETLPRVIRALPGNWTLAAFVPSHGAKRLLGNYGFAPGNIEIWDPSKKDAIEEVGVAMASATSGYMAMRSATGAKSTTNLFSMNAPKAADIKRNLVSLTPGSYGFENVNAEDLARIENARIDRFMELKVNDERARRGKPRDYVFTPGRAYYQMTKRERIAHDKQIAIAIWNPATNDEDVYVGPEARKMLGLPTDGTNVRISPGSFKGYTVFVLTKSYNRKLVPGTRVLVMR